MDVPWPYPEDGVASFLRDVLLPEPDTRWAWVICEAERPQSAIGLIEIRRRPHGSGQRGFWIGQPFWGRGYMTEAVIAVQDHVFLEAGLDELIVMNAPDNPASRRIKEKTGAEYLGLRPCAHHDGGDAGETWRIRAETWRRIRQG